MNKGPLLSFTLLVSALISLFASCAKDRTSEYDEKTLPNHVLQTTMEEWYLWNNSISDLDWKVYFQSPSDFLAQLIKQARVSDTWSFCTIDTIASDTHPIGEVNRNDTYGIDFVLMNDPTGETTRQYARVLTVFPNSPASQCGLQRGDFISKIDNTKISKAIMSQLSSGRSRRLTVQQLGIDTETELIYWAHTDTVQISASTQVAVPTVMVSRLLFEDVAYIMLTDLNNFADIAPSLKALLSTNPSDVIIDLRMCNQGTIECVGEMAQTLSNVSGTLLTTQWNSLKQANNTAIDIQGSTDINLYVITSGYTCGAPEWLIYGLKSLDESSVTTVGTITGGQTVMLSDFTTPYQQTLHPAVCYVSNGEGKHDYKNGITPDEQFDEFTYVWLYPYGDIREAIINHIISNH